MEEKNAKPGRPKNPTKNPYSVQLMFKVTKEEREEVHKISKKLGISSNQFIRDAVLFRLSQVPSGSAKKLFDTQTEIPVFVEKAKRKRKPSGSITTLGIQAHDKYSKCWLFLERFMWVASRHKRLERTILKTKDSKIPYFDSHDLDNMIRDMADEMWDAKKVLDALDALDHYNGDSDHEWGVADLAWLFHKPQRNEVGWKRMLKQWLKRPGAEDSGPSIPEVSLDQCKPMSKWLCHNSGFIEGTNEANAVLDFVYEKCNAYGYDKVRKVAAKFGIGPNGVKNFREAIKDPKNLE